MKRYKLVQYVCAVSIFACLTMASSGVAKPDHKPTLNQTVDFSLTLGEETFDPISQVVGIPTVWDVASQTGNDLRLVQFDGPIQESWVEAMRKAGMEPVQYIHPYTFRRATRAREFGVLHLGYFM